MSPDDLSTLLRQSVLVLDGAMGTELERRGIDLPPGAWSASVAHDHPSAVADVHRAYRRAGADIITTATYQTRSADILRQAAVLARQAVGPASPNTLVAGNIGGYGALLANGSEYTAQYMLATDGYRSVHEPRLTALADAGVDCILAETMPRMDELLVIVGCVQRLGLPLIVGLSVTAAATLADGTPLQAVARTLSLFPCCVAVGVNCCPPDDVLPALRSLAGHLPLLASPNTGERWDPVSHCWTGSPTLDVRRAREWVDAGARIVGLCCRSTPDDLVKLRMAIDTEPPTAQPGV